MKKTSIVLSAVVVAACLVFQACSTSQLTQTLGLITAGVDLALPIVEASGLVPAPAGALITTYLNAVDTAVSETANELASTDTTAVKVDKIAADFTGVVLPVIPGLTPTQQAHIKSVDDAVHAFLSLLGVPAPGAATTAHVASLPHNIKLSSKDLDKLVSVKYAAETQKDRLARVVK